MTTFGYQLRRVEGPTLEPVTLAEIKRQARIDDDLTLEDDDLAFWIQAAREHAEDFLRITLLETTWEAKFADFPRDSSQRLVLPMAHPLIAVESVQYFDHTGTERLLDGSDFQTVRDVPPYLLPLYAHTWPATNMAADAVTVRYRSGFVGVGSPGDASGVPAIIRQGIRMLAAAWYENRETMTDKQKNEIAYGFERALQAYRVLP
jgi:uncharacterized phiE125 gp8 family phage protein